MKTLQKVALAIVLITLIASCQTNSDPKKILANKETRKGIMDTIANNNEMMGEMMGAMMNSQNGKMMIQGNEKMAMIMMQNHGTMMNMMKDNPGMTKSMMSDMMESCKSDPDMMSSMCKTMMGNKQMMDMMQKMKGEKKGKKKAKGLPTKKHPK